MPSAMRIARLKRRLKQISRTASNGGGSEITFAIENNAAAEKLEILAAAAATIMAAAKRLNAIGAGCVSIISQLQRLRRSRREEGV